MRLNPERQAVLHFYNEGFRICRYDDFDYTILNRCPIDQGRGRHKRRLSEAFIMFDTETSKSRPDEYTLDKKGMRHYKENPNYIVKWSVAINIYGWNICCLWGDDPEQMISTLSRIRDHIGGTHTIMYCHNLSFDWMFLRKFAFAQLGHPVKQLNTKKHYPVNLEFENGIIFRDSLILSQRSMEKWGDDMKVVHAKAVGKWQYDRIRHQHENISEDELLYICNDVLCGVECLNTLRRALRKMFAGMPYTSTGIVRNDARKAGEPHHAHDYAMKQYTDWNTYLRQQRVYHGGYTHNNRAWKGSVITEKVTCLDFASSYPYHMIAFKLPVGAFVPVHVPVTVEHILKYNEDTAYIFTLAASGVRLKDHFYPMPALQVSKCSRILNGIYDNGRILSADFIEIDLTDIDLEIIMQIYDFAEVRICNCLRAVKDYIPRWLSDFVYELFVKKTHLKGEDPVLYDIAKATLNSVYGMTVQKPLPNDILEDFETGEYFERIHSGDDEFKKFISKQGTFLNYSYGVYVTALAMRSVYRLGACFSEWIYTDTDSVYGLEPDMTMVEQYNEECMAKLRERGYPGILHNGREYWLGVAELDGEYCEFIGLHSKCYAARSIDGKLKITVAGVPKKEGVKCLNDNIYNFKDGFIFDGVTTGKLTHSFQYTDEIYRNEYGDLIGDSINLYPCDYELDSTIEGKINKMFQEEVNIQIYDDDLL